MSIITTTEEKTSIGKQVIAQNTLYLTISHAASVLLAMLVTMALTRYLGPASYGDYVLAIAYLGLFVPLVVGSINFTIIRIGSQNPDKLDSLIGNGVLLSGVLTIIAFVLALLIIPVFGYSTEVNRLAILACLGLFLTPLALPRVAFLVTQNIKLLAVLDLVIKLLNTVLILLVVLYKIGNIETIILLNLIILAVSGVIYFGYSRRLISRPASFRVDWSLWRRLLTQSWPISLAGILVIIQLRLSQLLVGRTLDSVQVAQYTITLHLVIVFVPLLTLFFDSVYPLLSRSYSVSVTDFRRLIRFCFNWVMIFILPFALLVSLTGRDIITLYAGSGYVPGVLLLEFLIWVEVLHSAGFVLYYATLASGHQRVIPLTSLMFAVISIGLFILLLPRIGLLGIAVASLIARSAVFGVYYIYHPTREFVLVWFRSLWRPLVIVILVGLSLVVFQLPWYVTIILGIVLYVTLLFLFRVVRLGELKSIWDLIKHPGKK